MNAQSWYVGSLVFGVGFTYLGIRGLLSGEFPSYGRYRVKSGPLKGAYAAIASLASLAGGVLILSPLMMQIYSLIKNYA